VPALRNVQFLLTASISQRIHAMENTLRTKGIEVLYKPYTVDQLRESVHTQLRTDAARR
jgi:hypothetical protein